MAAAFVPGVGVGVLVVLGTLVVAATSRPLASITDRAGEVRVRLSIPAAILALRRTITIRHRDLVAVRVGDRDDLTWRTLRVLGTSVPAVLHAGRFRTGGATEFWALRTSRPHLVIDALVPWSRLRLDVDDPEAWRARLAGHADEGRRRRRSEHTSTPHAPGLHDVNRRWADRPGPVVRPGDD